MPKIWEILVPTSVLLQAAEGVAPTGGLIRDKTHTHA